MLGSPVTCTAMSQMQEYTSERKLTSMSAHEGIKPLCLSNSSRSSPRRDKASRMVTNHAIWDSENDWIAMLERDNEDAYATNDKWLQILCNIEHGEYPCCHKGIGSRAGNFPWCEKAALVVPLEVPLEVPLMAACLAALRSPERHVPIPWPRLATRGWLWRCPGARAAHLIPSGQIGPDQWAHIQTLVPCMSMLLMANEPKEALLLPILIEPTVMLGVSSPFSLALGKANWTTSEPA